MRTIVAILICLAFAGSVSAQKILLLDKVGTAKRKRIQEKSYLHVKLANGRHVASEFMFSDDNQFILMADTAFKLTDVAKVYSKGSKRLSNAATTVGGLGMIGSVIIFPFNGLINNDSPIVHKAFYPVFGGALLWHLLGRAINDRGFTTKPEKRVLKVLDLTPVKPAE